MPQGKSPLWNKRYFFEIRCFEIKTDGIENGEKSGLKIISIRKINQTNVYIIKYIFKGKIKYFIVMD